MTPPPRNTLVAVVPPTTSTRNSMRPNKGGRPLFYHLQLQNHKAGHIINGHKIARTVNFADHIYLAFSIGVWPVGKWAWVSRKAEGRMIV